MSTLLRPAPVSTSQVRYAGNGRFTAELSDLNGYGRVWSDACDIGLTLISHKTGKEVVFLLNRQFRDTEGEILFEEFVSVPTGAPHTAYVLTVFND